MKEFFLDPWSWLLMALMLAIGAMLFPFLGVIVPGLLIGVQRMFGFPRNVKTGGESLTGQEAQVLRRFQWSDEKECCVGRVRLGSECWNAVSKDLGILEVEVDQLVQIKSRDLLILEVVTLNVK